MIQRLLFLAILFSASKAIADWSTIQNTNMNGYHVSGFIVDVTLDSQRREVILKIKSEDASAVNKYQTVKICPRGNEIQDFHSMAQVDSIRQARAQHERVEIQFSSQFDQCVSTISFPTKN